VSDNDLERLKLAFAWHLSSLVMDADGVVRAEERAFLDEHFPMERLVAHGLVDSEGLWTEAFQPTVEEALRVLPTALSAEEKRALMGLLKSASRVEGAPPEAESNVIIVAARLLGLRPAEFLGN
jgi:uncharacterized tellurite resistance protein B-like protein